MTQRAVNDQRNRDCQVEERDPVEDKDAGPFWDGRYPIKDEEEQNQPQNCVDGFEWELGRRKN